jgi:hypothetical protein
MESSPRSFPGWFLHRLAAIRRDAGRWLIARVMPFAEKRHMRPGDLRRLCGQPLKIDENGAHVDRHAACLAAKVLAGQRPIRGQGAHRQPPLRRVVLIFPRAFGTLATSFWPYPPRRYHRRSGSATVQSCIRDRGSAPLHISAHAAMHGYQLQRLQRQSRVDAGAPVTPLMEWSGRAPYLTGE